MGLISKLVCVGVIGLAGYWAYDSHRAGLFSLPELPDGAYFLSYRNGFRAIVLDADMPDSYGATGPRYLRSLGGANRERKYLGVPFDVQPWFREAWSWCEAPTEGEREEFNRMPDEFRQPLETARFEAVCRINVDGEAIVRGLIFSVPRL